MARSVFVYRPGHPKADRWNMVDVNELCEEPVHLAINAPIMMDRFYENNAITTMNEKNEYVQRDIGSRRKYREYLKETGFTHASDYTQAWAKAAEKRERVKEAKPGCIPDKARRETLDRTFHKLRGY